MIVMKVILRLVMIIIFIFTHAVPSNEEKEKRENIEKNKKVIHEYLLIHIELAQDTSCYYGLIIHRNVSFYYNRMLFSL